MDDNYSFINELSTNSNFFKIFGFPIYFCEYVWVHVPLWCPKW